MSRRTGMLAIIHKAPRSFGPGAECALPGLTKNPSHPTLSETLGAAADLWLGSAIDYL